MSPKDRTKRPNDAGQGWKPDQVVAWHGKRGMARHGELDMEDGDPREPKGPRNPRSANDRQHPNGAGQSRKPDGRRGRAWRAMRGEHAMLDEDDVNVGHRHKIVSKSPRDRHRLHRRRSEHPQQQQEQLVRERRRPKKFLNDSQRKQALPKHDLGMLSQGMCQAAARGT